MAFAPSLEAPLLPPPHAAAAWGRRARATPPRLVLAASSRGGDSAPPTFERLREQLLQLHAEADLTHSKGMSNGEESTDEIRVFSGKVGDGAGETSGSLSKSGEKGSFQMKNVVYSNKASQSEQSDLQLADRFTLSNDHGPTNSINNRSAYDDFIEHIDSQLNSLEYELEQLVSSQLAQEVDIQQPRNGKWHKLRDILKLLTETRKRIANILDNTVSETGSEELR